ncbi:cytochrome-c peroxidase [Antarcticirhabdus aurantiaca]|uniref:Cytochrome-c peroxidase n=1 Tax=Antarcticirhabdus aurantiaca TaxID=2606717 RepID=A0ACD4NMY3_9HYPH|nr:cytochrome-c peroxidase [Jeongeuplla avenae]
MSCATCHWPELAWADDKPLSRGTGGKATRRNTPSLLHTARTPLFDWDGKGHPLAARSLAPLFDPAEMGPQTATRLEDRVGLGTAEIGESLAAYVRTLQRPSRFDLFLAGDKSALSDEELEGLHLFRTKAGCANCHSGQLLTDGRFHNLRLSSFGEVSQDLGRYDVTSVPEDAGRFRTPSLRHVSMTAPYMHNGLLPSLRAVVNFYARGGGDVRARNAAEAARPLFQEAARLSPLVEALTLGDSEREALVAFLKSL